MKLGTLIELQDAHKERLQQLEGRMMLAIASGSRQGSTDRTSAELVRIHDTVNQNLATLASMTCLAGCTTKLTHRDTTNGCSTVSDAASAIDMLNGRIKMRQSIISAAEFRTARGLLPTRGRSHDRDEERGHDDVAEIIDIAQVEDEITKFQSQLNALTANYNETMWSAEIEDPKLIEV